MKSMLLVFIRNSYFLELVGWDWPGVDLNRMGPLGADAAERSQETLYL